VLEGERILAFPDVLGHHVDAAPNLDGEVVKLETRIRLVQRELPYVPIMSETTCGWKLGSNSNRQGVEHAGKREIYQRNESSDGPRTRPRSAAEGGTAPVQCGLQAARAGGGGPMQRARPDRGAIAARGTLLVAPVEVASATRARRIGSATRAQGGSTDGRTQATAA